MAVFGGAVNVHSMGLEIDCFVNSRALKSVKLLAHRMDDEKVSTEIEVSYLSVSTRDKALRQ